VKAYDAIVVGAGPAGTTAALRMAQRGLKVILLERGHLPGAKNMFGGMLPRCPIIEELLPRFFEEAPLERHVVKRTLTILSEGTATSLVFESGNYDHPPYNGFTLYRPVFDRWYAQKAREAGASILTDCLVEGLIMKNNSISGVTVAREEGDVIAPVTVLCDGVLSLLARRAGLSAQPKASGMGLGVKALYRLDEETINERFGLVRDQGCSREFIGCTQGIRGGGFIYTQMETLSAGLVLHLDSLKKSSLTPYDLFEQFVAVDPIKQLLKDARLVEYSAHLIPEGGYEHIPRLFSDGLLIAGDSAGLCYTNGLNLEGMNLAVASGFYAAETVFEAVQNGDFSARQLARYQERLKDSFVLKDMKTYAKSSSLMQNDRLFSTYPNIIGTILEKVFQSDGNPRKKIGRIGWEATKGTVNATDLIADLIKGGRSLL
jgi:electron transfer flavoprotein-quinone oxidoreductase